MMEEASNTMPMALDLWPEVPTSIGDPETTMKLIHATIVAHCAPREVGAATATRRSINPSLVTFVTTSMQAQMSMATSTTAGPHAMKQRWSIVGNSTLNMRDLLPIRRHFLSMH